MIFLKKVNKFWIIGIFEYCNNLLMGGLSDSLNLEAHFVSCRWNIKNFFYLLSHIKMLNYEY